MDYKDYAETYNDMGEAFIEILLQKKDSQDILKKIRIWNYDFDDILDTIPLNDDGKYVGLAYHQNIDVPWKNIQSIPWEMDELEISLSQIQYVKSNLIEENLLPICEDICDILEEAISGENKVFIIYTY